MAVEALIRSGTRSGGEFIPIGMDEALRTATMWLSMLRHNSPDDLTLCVGKKADLQLAGDWVQKFGSKNLFTDRSLSAANAPQPRCKNQEISLVLAFGSGLGRGAKNTQNQLAMMRKNGAKIVSINPVKTGLSALADQWLAIRPGGDEAVLQVLLGEKPCNYNQLANTDLSVLDMERLVREIEANKDKITIMAGRGVFSHSNGSHTSALLTALDADILPIGDHIKVPYNMTSLLSDDCQALLCMNSALPWHSHPRQALEDFEGRVICLSDQPDGFEACADLVFCGAAEDNLIALAARLGLDGFSDVQGNSPFANGYADYLSMAEKPSQQQAWSENPVLALVKDRQGVEPDAHYPFHAITQKAHADANRSVVFMNSTKAKFLGLASKDIVWVKSKYGKVQAVLGLMDEMNENTLWSWGGSLFAGLLPQDNPLRDAATGQPGWFDLQVAVEKVNL